MPAKPKGPTSPEVRSWGAPCAGLSLVTGTPDISGRQAKWRTAGRVQATRRSRQEAGARLRSADQASTAPQGDPPGSPEEAGVGLMPDNRAVPTLAQAIRRGGARRPGRADARQSGVHAALHRAPAGHPILRPDPGTADHGAHQVDDFPWFPPGRLPDQECPKSPDKPAWLEASSPAATKNASRPS
jgi:hypothetical protein